VQALASKSAIFIASHSVSSHTLSGTYGKPSPLSPSLSPSFLVGVCVVAALSPLRGWFTFHFPPTAYAVGCILAPLRGWKRIALSPFSNTIELRYRLIRDPNSARIS